MYLNTSRVLRSIGYVAKDIKNSSVLDAKSPVTPKFGKK